MRRLTLLCCAAALVGCAKSDRNTAADSTAAAGAMETPPATVSMAIPAGSWTGRAMLMEGDSVLSTWTLVTTADTAGWTITFPNQQPIPVRVLAMGDSTVIQFTHEGALHAGQQGTVISTARLQGDSVAGTFEERLANRPDSVIRGRTVATRAP